MFAEITATKRGLKAALAASLFLTGIVSVHAATVAAPNSGDLFLAFRVEGGVGANTSYIVNIGSDLNYRNAAAGSVQVLTLTGVGADLAATYGAGWDTRADLHWAIFGARLSVNSAVYASFERDNLGSAAAAPPSLTQQARNATAGSIIDVVTGYSLGDTTLNNPAGTFQTNSANDSSYFKQVATAGTTDFGSLSQWNSIEGNFGGGAAGTALDLYRVGGTGVTSVGTFSINNLGDVTFAAVPEPGVSVLAIAGAALGLTSRRRRAEAV